MLARERYPVSPLAHWLLPSNCPSTDQIENTAPTVVFTESLASSGHTRQSITDF
jgi:hypothetical protein